MDHLARQRAIAPVLATALVLAALASGIGAGAALAGPLGGFSVRPAQFNPAVPATRAYFIDHVRAGSTFSEDVVVSNTSSRRLNLLVDPVDGLTGATSGTVYANRGVARRGASRWVSVRPATITLGPDSSRSVPFSVRVPARAAPGDHLAGLAFENAARTHSSGHFSVTIVTRQVIGILVVVRGPARPQIALTRIAFRELTGARLPAAVISLANVGAKLCKPRLAVTLDGRAAVTRQLDTVLPGSRIPYPLVWPRRVPRGAHRVTVLATKCGRTTRLAIATYVGQALTDARFTTRATPHVMSPASSDGAPWWLVIVVGMCCGGAGLGLALRHRPRPVT